MMNRRRLAQCVCTLIGFAATDVYGQVGLTVCEEDGSRHTIEAFIGELADMDVYITSVRFAGAKTSGLALYDPASLQLILDVAASERAGLYAWTVTGVWGDLFGGTVASFGGGVPFYTNLVICSRNAVTTEQATDSPKTGQAAGSPKIAR